MRYSQSCLSVEKKIYTRTYKEIRQIFTYSVWNFSKKNMSDRTIIMSYKYYFGAYIYTITFIFYALEDMVRPLLDTCPCPRGHSRI